MIISPCVHLPPMISSDLAKDRTIMIRADGGPGMGTGHIMRCFSIAQRWMSMGGDVVFLKDDHTPFIDRMLTDEGVKVHHLRSAPMGPDDIQQVRDMSEEVDAMIIDGYHFSDDYISKLRETNPLLMVDDLIDRERYDCDILLNFNLYASKEYYEDKVVDGDMLIGPEFFPIRREFWPYFGKKRSIRTRVENILLTMGGSDPHDYSSKVVSALSDRADPGIEFHVVIGSAFDNRMERFTTSDNIIFHRDVRDMSTLMNDCDLAISSAGTTSFELAFMGTPSIHVSIARNQVRNAESWRDRGGSFYLGWCEDVPLTRLHEAFDRLVRNEEERRRMSNICQVLVDGGGSSRICDIMLKLSQER